jgi:tRNA nucleotidyltransferase (CCA-adding enzyme)
MPGLITLPPGLGRIVQELQSAGHLTLVIGGAVRDALRGSPAKDIDIEVYNISLGQLAAFLEPRGVVELVGNAFGMIKFRGRDGEDSRSSRAPRLHHQRNGLRSSIGGVA